AILRGDARPRDAAEQIVFAMVCQLSKRHAAAARLYADAFAEQPKLADDLQCQPRYSAARAAALVSCGQGKDVEQSDAKERALRRRQALGWLHADLAAYRRLLDEEPDKARSTVGERMQHRLQDKDFDGVRGTAALDKLPEVERQQWQTLW